MNTFVYIWKWPILIKKWVMVYCYFELLCVAGYILVQTDDQLNIMATNGISKETVMESNESTLSKDSVKVETIELNTAAVSSGEGTNIANCLLIQ